ncbi:MAG: Outer membrane lipoprotein carrier protein LolA [Candidatus Tokpelaia sp. JSC085]|nr:MAG: Outer membrane lipoprotein carrier protein LolA [Candidatus Tokpelaia sp. JSC085]
MLSSKSAIVICTATFFGIGSTIVACARIPEKTEFSIAQKIADNFSRIRTMTGNFIQFSPRGKMTQGTFYLERPGKILFIYQDSPIRIISDGKSLVINNNKLDTWSIYQLRQTPMNILLSDKIDLSHGQLLEFRQTPEAVTMLMAYGASGSSPGTIRMIFDPKTYELRQWTMIDRQHLETTVQLVNSRTGVHFADGIFDIDYKRISMKRNRE